MGAAWFAAPEIELADHEAKALATAIKEVERHYPMPIRKDYAAIGAFATVAFAIYRDKFKRIAARKRAAKAGGAPNPIASGPGAFDPAGGGPGAFDPTGGLRAETATVAPDPWFAPAPGVN